MPDRVGRYELLLPIASGGMGRVFLARNLGAFGFAREFALKLTHPHLTSEEDFAADLLHEAKIAGQIRHHNVVQVVDVGHDPLGIFLVMDYVEGETLGGFARRARQTSVPVPDAVTARVLLDALAGLHAAHELTDDSGALLGIVHRDFSPHNILVGLDGVAKLTDFGIAKATTRLGHTRAGLVKGKLAYMAPEQARGQALDRRCDVWAAGVVAWETFAGRRLFEIEDVSTLLSIVSEPPPLLSSVRPDVPPAIDATIALALTIPRDHRCPSAAELSKRLTAAASASFGIASPEEVAAYVRSVAGPKLEDRRKKITEILALRARMSELGAVEAAADPSGSSAVPAERVAEPAPVEAAAEPAPIDAPVAMEPPRPAPVSPASVSPAIVAPDVPPPIAVSPSGFPEAETVSVATPSAFRVAQEPRRRREPAPVWRHPAVLAAGAGAVAATVLFLIVWASQPSATPSPSAAPASSAGSAERVAAAATAVPPPVATAAPSASVAASAAPTATLVHLAANAAISGVSVGGRWVPVQPPERELDLELTSDETSRKAVVQVVSTDQRRATTILEPGAKRAIVTFKDAPKGGKLMRWE
jgi:serine/threonine-protein kinase